jgi:hypothetical protein
MENRCYKGHLVIVHPILTKMSIEHEVFFEIVESATRDLKCHGIAMPLLIMLGALPLVTLMGLPCAVPNIMGHGLTTS